MIIRRLPGRTLFWGPDLRPSDPVGTAAVALTTLTIEGDRVTFSVNGQKRELDRGRSMKLGPVTIALRQTDERGAWYDIRAPKTILIRRDDQ